MSYIRCLSNPEALYIWSDGKFVTISHNVLKPHSSGRDFTIPDDVFKAICRRWVAYQDPAVKDAARAEEVHVHTKTGRRIPEWKPCRHCTPQGKNAWIACRPCARKHRKDAGHDFKIRLSYRKDFVYLWRVTWEYVVMRFREDAHRRAGQIQRGRRYGRR